MVYTRVRNSRYAQYHRATGKLAQFTIPRSKTANFSPWMDMLNQGMSMGQDVMGQMGGAIGNAAHGGMDMLQNAGGGIARGIGNLMDGNLVNTTDGLSGMASRVGQTVGDMSTGQQAGLAGAGTAALGGLGAMANSARKGMGGAGQVVDDVAEAGDGLAQGLRAKAGSMLGAGKDTASQALKNPYALGAAGLGTAGAVGGGAYAMTRPEDQM